MKVPGWTVMRNCASGMQAIDSAINNIRAGRSNLVLAGGVDALSRAPLLYSDAMVLWLANWYAAKTLGQRAALAAKFKLVLPRAGDRHHEGPDRSDGRAADGPDRREPRVPVRHHAREMDEFAARSHQRVLAAQKAGHFDGEVVPLYDASGKLYAQDDGVREDSTAENLAKLKPFFDRKYGNVTAGNSSQITDGAAWLADRVGARGRQAQARRRSAASSTPSGRGSIRRRWGSGPVHAATPILTRHGLGLNDLDAWEINEAFAAQVIACERAWQSDDFCTQELGLPAALGALDEAKLNVDGGAIALGHPVGASGARIVLHVLNVLKRTGGRRGMAAICIGGGLGGAMLVERV